MSATFSVNLITQAAEAIEALTYAQEQKNTLEFEIQSLTRRTLGTNDSASKIKGSITAAEVEKEAFETMISSGRLTDPKLLKEYQRRIAILDNEIEELGFKNEDKGAVYLLKKEMQLERAKSELVQVNDFIAQVTARQAQLV